MLNINAILLIAVEMLDLDRKSLGIYENIQKNRFKNFKDIKEEKVNEIKSKILKELYRNFKSKELVLVFETMINEYFKIQQSLKSINIKSEDDEKRLNWIMLKRFFIPFLAIKMAELDITYSARQDKGLSGGRFWYLPDLTIEKNKLDLPLTYMIKWWKDLCGKGLGSLSNEIDELLIELDSDSPISGVENTLKSWRKTNALPKRETLNRYLNTNIKYEGCFKKDKSLSLHQQFKEAKSFVENIKKLNIEDLCHELPEETLLKKVYSNKKLTDSNKKEFIKLVYERWKKPSKRNLVSKFITARATQYIWIKLHKYFKINRINNKEENCILQLVMLFQGIYNLEMIRYKYNQYPNGMDIFTTYRYIVTLNNIYTKSNKNKDEQNYEILIDEIVEEFKYLQSEKKTNDFIIEIVMLDLHQEGKNKESFQWMKKYQVFIDKIGDKYMYLYPDFKEKIKFIKNIP